MKRKSLLFLLLFALMAPWAANAQVQIGSGETTNNYLPSYSYYNYSISQQIYTADEIAASGNITSIAFYNGGTVKARKYDIYMALTDKSAFENTGDWFALTDANIVYHGTEAVTMTAGAWTTFTLDTPFAYNGTSNLVVCMIDRTGSYSSGMACRVFSATNQSLYGYNDYWTALSPNGTNDGTALTGTRPAVKNQIILGGIQQAYPAPMDLACTGVTANSATLSWTEIGTATSWQICLDDDETNPIPAATNPFTVTGLTAEQTYTAKVRGCYDGNHYSSWSGTTTFTPTAKIVIGSGTATSNYLPTYIYYLNSLTQQIYTPAELGEAGIITSIDFYCTANNTYARNFDIYMVSTSKSSFESTTDWINVTTGDLVYSGSVTLAAGWNTFEFDNGFEYDGTSNVAIIVDANATDYQNGIGFYVYDAPTANQAIYVYSDGTNYDPFNPTTASGRLSVKNQLRLAKEPLPPCTKPTGFAVTEVTNHTATFSWTSDADAWQLCINGDEENPIPVTTNPYTLTGLDAETSYRVMLRANCGGEDGVSSWTSEVRFTTDVACPTPTVTVNNITPTTAEASWTGEASSYNLRYRPVGSAPIATVILTAGDVWGDGSGYQMLLDADATAYGTIIPETGGLTSSGDASAATYAEFEYKIPVNADGSMTTTNVVLDNSIAIQIPAGTYDWCITNPTPDDRIWIASGNGSIPGRYDDYVFEAGNVYEFTVSFGGQNDQVDLTINGAKSAPKPAYAKAIVRRGEVKNIANVMPSIHNYNKLPLEVPSRDEEEWIVVEDVTSPYTLDVEPGTSYEVQVMAICGGEDGSSEWSASTYFTTPTFCDAPFALNVPFETLMPTTATLNWNGYQDGFEVRYRPVDSYEPIFEENFENGIPSTWTTIDADGDGNNWFALSDIGTLYPFYASLDLSEWAHGGSNSAMSSSAYNDPGGESYTALDSDHWLITPQLTLGGTLKYYVRSANSSYADSYELLLSTTGNATTDFTITLKEMAEAPSTWTEVTIDLSEDYANQQGYIAIHHVSSDMYFLYIDDFGLYNLIENEWTTVSTDAQFVDIEDLDPETEYEWQVRGEHRGCTNGEEDNYTPWSTMGTFTTPGLCDPFARITIDTVTGTSVTLSWLGYQESYNVRYRTPADADEVFYDDFSEYEDIDDDGYITLADTDWTGSNLNDDEEQPSDIYSLSFTDGTSMTVFGFAGNGEDQYLISPEFEVENAGILEFYYLAYQASTQTFQVGFSSTDNALTSFTWSEAFTNGTEDYTDYYQIEVPAGTKYFAIKSSGESSLLFLSEFYVGDNYVPASEWIVFEGVTDNPYTITGLTPGTIYQVGIQGNCTETTTTDWYGGYFMTPDVQVIDLIAGSNWFSTNREITLDDLKAALRAALPSASSITITSQRNGKSTWNGRMWTGQLRALDVTQMYKITVPEDCEIEFNADPINPADHPVTIVPGANWIGYQLQTGSTVTNVFAGFPTNGDLITSQTNGKATWNGRMWTGQLRNLVPGKGYIYNSKASDSKTFIFPTSSKAAKKSSSHLKGEKKTLPTISSIQKVSR